MSRDPIVDEVRQTRLKILDDCGGDLEGLLNRLKAAEAQDRERMVVPRGRAKPLLLRLSRFFVFYGDFRGSLLRRRPTHGRATTPLDHE